MNFFRGNGGSGLMSDSAFNKKIKRSLKPDMVDGDVKTGIRSHSIDNTCLKNKK